MRSSILRPPFPAAIPAPTSSAAASPAPAAEAPPDVSGIADLVEDAHRTLQELTARTSSSGIGPDAVDAYDGMVAAISGHLAVGATVLLPAARRRAPEQRAVAARLAHRRRHLERELQMLQGRLHGDRFALPLSLTELREHVSRELRAYAVAEAELARALDAACTPAQRQRLMASWTGALQHAPTRPHPYATHAPGLRRLVLRGDFLWDAALDLVDNRVVPRRRPQREPRQLTTWGRYLLGASDFTEREDGTPDARRRGDDRSDDRAQRVG